ncbi:MAG: hypothetical protein IAE91_15175 [Ignavibacteriaceae bacterium]|nr:hypothetical protein [Ignavibacteriaceae bacterium]
MKFLSTFIIIFILSLPGYSQFPSTPVNLAVCDTTGDQTVPKISIRNDGGSYIGWFDNRGGSYAVYLQRLSPSGYKMWANQGLLISNNSQNSSLVDWDMITDSDGNAILVFTDVRNGNLRPFAYKISPEGQFLWGANGVELSQLTDYQADPRVVQTSDGNYVFGWIVASSPQKIGLQKLNSSGIAQWGTEPVLYASGTTENWTYVRMVPSDNGSVIIVHSAYTGPFFSASAKLFSQKFSSSGTQLWGQGGIQVQGLGRVAGTLRPTVITDGNNGAIVGWHDDRNNLNLQSAYIQRINSGGTFEYPANGVELSTRASRQKYNPIPAIDFNSGEVFTVFEDRSSGQTSSSVFVQKVTTNGSRAWGDNGINIYSDVSNSFGSFKAFSSGGNYTALFYSADPGGVSDTIKAIKFNSAGNTVWPNGYVTVSNPSNKIHSDFKQTTNGVIIGAWGANFNESGDIYAQNLNPNGTLGEDPIPVELTSFSISDFNGKPLLSWETATELNNSGFEITKTSTYTPEIKTGFVPGKGTTTEKSSYSFIDEGYNFEQGTVIYKLYQIDFDGTRTLTAMSEFYPASLINGFQLLPVYPNPVVLSDKNEIKIGFMIDEESTVKLTFYEVTGAAIETVVNRKFEAGMHEISKLLTNISNGVYFVNIISINNSGKTQSKTVKFSVIQ